MFKYNTHVYIYLHTCAHSPHESTVCVLKPFSITAIAQERQQSIHSYIYLLTDVGSSIFIVALIKWENDFGKMLS